MPNTTTPKVAIDAKGLIRKLGGPQDTAVKIERDTGTKISTKALEKWGERQRVPLWAWLFFESFFMEINDHDPDVLDNYILTHPVIRMNSPNKP